MKNAYKEIHILVQIQPSCLQLYKNELLLIYFQQFYLHTKQFFKFELFVKILKQLFPEFMSIATSLTVDLIHIFIAHLEPVWRAIIASHYHEY